MTALTYIITHADFRAVKVGCITGTSNRLEYFARRGWEHYRSLAVCSKQLAHQIEQATLFEVRFRLHIPPYLTEAQMDNGGWTETSSLALIGAAQVWDIACEQAGLIRLAPNVRRGRPMRQPPAHRRSKGDALPFHPIAKTEAALERGATPHRIAAANGHH